MGLPLYVAVMLWVPKPSPGTVSFAVSTLLATARLTVPSTVAPSLNVMLPAGCPVPVTGLTTALSFAFCPRTMLDGLALSTVRVGAAPAA